jgi:hypothetical protein
MHGFIERIKNDPISLQERMSFDGQPLPNDEVKRLNSQMIEITTPADKEGFGTGAGYKGPGAIIKSALPVQSVIALGDITGDVNLATLRVRLPADQEHLTRAIILVQEFCLRRSDGVGC